MEKLLRASAVFEIATGAGLFAAPVLLVSILIGGDLATPAGIAAARVAAIALIALGIGCWLGSADPKSRASAGIVAAMLFYNSAIVVLFLFLRFGEGLTGIGLLPVAALHAALGVWCSMLLKKRMPGIT